ncbi:MAG: helix-turn-helix domain-containing protein [Rhodospirillaceae bacterium]|nr:helix-turn-helix domain-containing protein [Rhodospirillaceae bacterium]
MARKPTVHPEDIKAAVRKTGITLTALSLSAGLSNSTCRASLRRPIPAGNRVIADHLGKRVSDLWPQWYDAQGVRIHSKSRAKDIIASERGHRQKKVTK